MGLKKFLKKRKEKNKNDDEYYNIDVIESQSQRLKKPSYIVNPRLANKEKS
ncbi:MAG: hypothetical protein U9M94_03925 [Patescibacteria group bacterium]|nr:hypothetical protein [Patescibacteria group bacterium]